MEKIKIFTDSSIDLPEEILENLNVSIVPMNITMGDREYVDLADIDSKKILDYARQYNEIPKTACPTFEQFEKVLENLGEDDFGIFLLISAKSSSSTHLMANNIIQAKNLGSRVKIIDSKSLSGGLGILLLNAIKLVDSGLDFEEVLRKLEQLVPKINTGFVIDKLDHLYYGGRCSQMTLLFSSSFKIKPLINLLDGEMKVTKKYRGNLLKVLEKYVGDMVSEINNIDSKNIVISHTLSDDTHLNFVLDKIKALKYFENVYVANASATITSHAGENTVGLFYLYK